MNKNNWNITENKEKSYYRLWRVIYPNYVISGLLPEKKVMYSFNTKSEYEGMIMLLNYIEKVKLKVKKARIYNNKTNDLVKIFDNNSLSMRNATPEEIEYDRKRNLTVFSYH